jgi:hypothetical protein
MSRRTLVRVCVTIFYVLALTLIVSGGHTTYTQRIGQDFVQKEIDAHLPNTSHGVTIQAMTVTLDNKIDVLLEMTGKKLTRSFTMVVHAVGQPDYEHSKNGELYFKPSEVKIVDHSFNGTPPGQLLGVIRDRYVHKDTVKNLLTDIAPHVEDWMIEAAEKTAVVALEHVPIYRMKSSGAGFFLGGALSNVSVEGDKLAITFNVWMVALMVILGIIILVLAVIVTIAVIANPDFGIGLFLLFS